MPCLNEADTLEVCIQKAWRGLKAAGADGEVLVADNGSTDPSVQIAERCGARVVHVAEKGYGNALMAGIESAKGQFVIMGDADDSYDFQEIPCFVEKLRAGADLVQGCRLPAGEGIVKRGAMPFLHRWWGNPMFSLLARVWFGAPIHDVYCGLRGFRKDFHQTLLQRCTGMEFATEMIIKASLRMAKIEEVPITLHPDGRKAHAPHLKTFRDGWRTLRFFLMCSPKWVFLLPGFLLVFRRILKTFADGYWKASTPRRPPDTQNGTAEHLVKHWRFLQIWFGENCELWASACSDGAHGAFQPIQNSTPRALTLSDSILACQPTLLFFP